VSEMSKCMLTLSLDPICAHNTSAFTPDFSQHEDRIGVSQ